MLLMLAIVSLLLAAVPAILFLRNLQVYVPPPQPLANAEYRPQISLLIPARDEERSIGEALAAALASTGVDLEVIVLDDHSTDHTGDIVRRIAAGDDRVRWQLVPELPVGWCGKQHACWTLSQLATHRLIAFVDADVRLQPRGLARMTALYATARCSLLSGVPRQVTVTLGEKLLIPLIHFLLLGFLPIQRMRASVLPAYGAGCGQLFMTDLNAYSQAGGHAAIRASMHDGLQLPRAYRMAGLRTDLFDATDVASCRMYRSSREVLQGLAKNAVEGLAAPKMILPATLLLIGGQVLPWMLLTWALNAASVSAAALSFAAIALSYVPRIAAALRFRQSWIGAMLHPLGITLFLAIQWAALIAHLRGRPARWKSRSYALQEKRTPATRLAENQPRGASIST